MIYIKLISMTMFTTLLVSSVIASQYADIKACMLLSAIGAVGMLASIYSMDKK